MADVLAPQPLSVHHDVSAFENGKHTSLDQWLKERAHQSDGVSARTYVVCRSKEPSRVVGYYALSTAMEERLILPRAKLRHGLPSQVPLLLIGRLAIDRSLQGRGLGADLLSDAVRRCCAAADIAGARAIIAHAIDEEAARFYVHHGFLRSGPGELVMILPIETARASL
jgi:GNAT superfamily N-acetyltransferase